jgi:hypothetical protein
MFHNNILPKLLLKKDNINNYQTFNLDLTHKQKKILNEINFKSNKEAYLTLNGLYGYDKLITSTLSHVLIDNNSNNKLKKIIKSIIKEFIQLNNKNSALIHLRLSNDTKNYDLSRWHQDGSYGQQKCQFKLISSLKGPSTLILPFDEIIKKKSNEFIDESNKIGLEKGFNSKEYIRADNSYRKYMDKFSKNKLIGNYDSVYTSVNSYYATYHSEPPIHEPRIVLAVLPLNKDELKKCKQKTKITFY